MKKYWIVLTIFMLSSCLVFFVNTCVFAQIAPDSDSRINGSPVIVDNKTLFTIQEKFGLSSTQQRAKEISNRIEEVADDISISIDSLQVSEVEGVVIISSEDLVLIGITEADAKAAGKTQQDLGKEYLTIIKNAVYQYREERSLLNLLRSWFTNPLVIQLLILGIGIVVISLIFRYLSRSLPGYISDSDISYRLRKIITFTGYLATLLFITIVFSDRLGRLTVIFGVVGAGIAFALQEIIGSFAGWIAISLGQFYKPGDRVQLGGIMGDVIDISILRTTLMECGDWVKADLYNGRIVRIANSFVFKEPVFNYSGDFHFVWDEITVPIKYGSDRAQAKLIFQQVLDEVIGEYINPAKAEWSQMVHKYLIEEQRIEPAVTLVVNDNWLEFTLRYVVDYKRRRGTKDKLFTRIMDEVEKSDNAIAIASTTLHLVEAPVLDVRVKQKNSIGD